MQEIPILVVLMYQLFKQQIHSNVSEFIPLIMDFINMRPLPEQRYVSIYGNIYLNPIFVLVIRVIHMSIIEED